jgi:hypothetical protein
MEIGQTSLLLTKKQLAAILGMSTRFIEKQQRYHGLPKLSFGGRVRYDLDAVLAWAREGGRLPVKKLPRRRGRPRNLRRNITETGESATE